MKKYVRNLFAVCMAVAVAASGITAAHAAADNSHRYTWDHVNMGCYGFVTGMAVHPQNPDLMYVRTDVGGMYKYDAENQKWIQLMESIPEKDKGLSSVRSVALDPVDENVIYAVAALYEGNTLRDVVIRKVTGSEYHFEGNFNADGDVIKFFVFDGRGCPRAEMIKYKEDTE